MNAISVAELRSSFVQRNAPIVVDARPERDYRAAGETIAGALRRDPQALASWAQALPRAASVVVYGAQDGDAAQDVAQALAERGIEARWLEGGLRAWAADKGALDRKPAGGATRWVTRERPKIDRIACPWLIARFVDRGAEFLYVPPKQVREVAQARDAVPYDVPDVHFAHEGERCSFDAFIAHYRLGADPALARLACGDRDEGLVAVVRTPTLEPADLRLPADPLVLVLEGVEKPERGDPVIGCGEGRACVVGLRLDAAVLPDKGTDIRSGLLPVYGIQCIEKIKSRQRVIGEYRIRIRSMARSRGKTAVFHLAAFERIDDLLFEFGTDVGIQCLQGVSIVVSKRRGLGEFVPFVPRGPALDEFQGHCKIDLLLRFSCLFCCMDD